MFTDEDFAKIKKLNLQKKLAPAISRQKRAAEEEKEEILRPEALTEFIKRRRQVRDCAEIECLKEEDEERKKEEDEEERRQRKEKNTHKKKKNSRVDQSGLPKHCATDKNFRFSHLPSSSFVFLP